MPKRYHHVIRPLPKSSVKKARVSDYGEVPGVKMSIAQSNPAEAAERMALESQPDGNELAVAQYKNAVKKVGGSIKQSSRSPKMTRGCGYHKHQLHLSVAQQKKLVKGHKVRVKHGHLGFSDSLQHVPVHLTATQMRRIERAHAGQRGADIQFTSNQQRMMHGKGFFGDLWKGIKNVGRRAYEVVKPVVTEHVLPAVRQHVLPRVTNYATNLLENRIAPALAARADVAAQRLADHVESGVNRGLNLVDQGVSRVGLGIGGSLRSRRGRIAKRGRGMRGAGFFDDVWSGIKSVGSHALPIATNLVVNRALGPLKALTGGRGRRRVTRGGAPFATGHR